MSTEETAEMKLESIANTTDLGVAIKRLESKKLLMEQDLKVRFRELATDLKPANILKNTIHEVQESTTLKNNLLKVALALGAGYFSRKLIVSKSAGMVKKALGTVLQYGITNFIAKKSDQDYEETPGAKRKNLFRRILSI